MLQPEYEAPKRPTTGPRDAENKIKLICCPFPIFNAKNMRYAYLELS